MKKYFLFLSLFILLAGTNSCFASSEDELVSEKSGTSEQKYRAGDPDVEFDKSKFDADYPQIREWIKAGVRGGIPFVDKLEIKETLEPGVSSSAINAAINKVAKQGGGAVLLKKGTYNINAKVRMKSKVALVGEDRKETVCVINKGMMEGAAFEFGANQAYSGIYRLTIKGGWVNRNGENKPLYDWNVGSKEKNNELDGNGVISVFFVRDSHDCWIDDMDILNSADFPMRSYGAHHTMRNIHVDGCFNKHGGCHGYFFLMNTHNLVTECHVTHIRHISIQGEKAEYNVLYNNDFEQEISFHHGDNGNNLIEYNRVTLPEDMPNKQPNYFAIMGPWSIQHSVSANDNFIFRNRCLEKNHDNATPWSDDSKVYVGPMEVKHKEPHKNFIEKPQYKVPSGGTFYPIR